MRTIQVTLFKFDELSEDAQHRAIAHLADINVDHNWWEYVYEDAARIGLKITGFNEYKCEGTLTETVGEVCRRIIKDHGRMCGTHKTALDYYKRKRDGRPIDEDEFLRALLEDYRIMLNSEYEYLTGDEAVAESIRANEYEFTADGAMR